MLQLLLLNIHFFLQLADSSSHPYVETSVKNGKGVKKAVYKLAETLIHTYGIFQPGQEVRPCKYNI